VCLDVNQIARRVWNQVEFVHCNSISFVPKTAKTLRSIAIEPTVNAFLQKGIDLEMRKHLKVRANIDLANDFEKNRLLAQRGSIDGEYFTMDLSSASDTIARELVRVLLPPDWFEFLNSIRSHSYELQGKVFPYHKFVSMGNGFCFPLETLIFASALKACKSELGLRHTSSSVYGDDIVADSRLYDLLRKLLAFCGFIVNDEKTYARGPFRESCGADWHSGQDVRPVYLKAPIARYTELIGFHNVCLRSPEIYELMKEVMSYLRSLMAPDRYYQPFNGFGVAAVSNYGNFAFVVEHDLFMTGRWVRWSRPLQNWVWKGITTLPVKDVKVSIAASYISFLRGSPSGDLYLRYTTNYTTK
jgi:hypothetical protein